MHTLWLFLNWPNGTAWSNVVAMPVCGVVAGLAAYFGRNKLGAVLKPWFWRHLGHHSELDALTARMDAHADLLDTSTPGGLATVLDEVRRAVTAAESAHEAVRALGVINKPAPRRGATPMRKAAGAKDSSDGKA